MYGKFYARTNSFRASCTAYANTPPSNMAGWLPELCVVCAFVFIRSDRSGRSVSHTHTHNSNCRSCLFSFIIWLTSHIRSFIRSFNFVSIRTQSLFLFSFLFFASLLLWWAAVAANSLAHGSVRYVLAMPRLLLLVLLFFSLVFAVLHAQCSAQALTHTSKHFSLRSPSGSC